MPTYTYRCRECQHEFDIRQRFSEDALTDCPNCGVGQSLRKVVNSVGIVFKGNGFYVTDNRNGSKAKSGKGEKTESDKSSDKSSDKATENKAEKSTKSSEDKAKPKKTTETAA